MEELFIDVNVFMYAAGKPHEYKNPCEKIVDAIEKGKIRAAVDTEIIQEVLYRYHFLGLSEFGYELSWHIIALKPRILPVDEDTIKLALYYYKKYLQKGIKPRDALHIASMVQNNLARIISTDLHFEEVKEITRIDPARFSF